MPWLLPVSYAARRARAFAHYGKISIALLAMAILVTGADRLKPETAGSGIAAYRGGPVPVASGPDGVERRFNPTRRGMKNLPVLAFYAGPRSARLALEQNLAQPLAPASADFDEDGVPDLAVVYAGSQGGILALYRGNVDAIYPNTAEAKRRRQSVGTDGGPSPFLATAHVFDLPAAPDFVGAGDFNADGHFDLVFAARGGDKLYLLAGNGRGEFGKAEEIALAARVTALTTGEINRADGLADIVVGVANGETGKVLVFEGPEGAWRAQPEVFSLLAAPADLSLGLLDVDTMFDLAIAAGSELMVVHGRDRNLSLDQARRDTVPPAKVSRRALPFPIRSLAVGRFADGPRTQVAALCDDGSIQVVSATASGWQSEPLSEGLRPQASRLIGARVTGGRFDDLVVTDTESRQVRVVGRQKSDAREAAALEVEGSPVAALPMRLNGDALSDLVLLQQGRSAPTVIASQPAATFTVNSTESWDDTKPGDGVCAALPPVIIGALAPQQPVCTLRAAIQEANALAGPDIINFNIPTGAGTVKVIASELPFINDPVTIDGTTQPNFAGTPIIQLFTMGGLIISSSGSGSVIRGLAISGAELRAIYLASSNNIIEGNYIGPSVARGPVGNFGVGIFIDGRTPLGSVEGSNQVAVSNNTIGGTVAAARNVISANSDGEGVLIDGGVVGSFFTATANVPATATGNKVQGNFIGTDTAGASALENANGVTIKSATNNTIGGTTAGARNLISGNSASGILVTDNANSNSVLGNFIGLNAAGNAAIPNGCGRCLIGGIYITRSANNNSVGGSTQAARNVISGNNGDGIGLWDDVTGTQILGNFIGTQADGVSPLGNTGSGTVGGGVSIRNFASNNQIGGQGAGEGNVIAYNSPNGVVAYSGTSNSILGNSIFGNTGTFGLGIDLGGDGVTQNDAGDGDSGANDLQNFPVLISAVNNGGITTISGTLNSVPNAAGTIELFTNTTCDGSGFGEGESFLRRVPGLTNGNGVGNFNVRVPTSSVAGRSITATATLNGTSEFSSCVQVVECPTYPDGFVPFTSVDPKFIAGPNASGDFVIVAPSTLAALNTIRSSVALPQFLNEQFCSEVMLAPGLLAVAYVPDVRERAGDFSNFGAPLIDPITGQPFPGNIIPANRLGGIYAWRIKSFRPVIADLAIAKTASPSPVFVNNLLTYTVSVTNSGPGAATGVFVADTLPPGVTLSSAGATQGGCSQDGNGIFCNLGVLPVGGQATITIIINVPPTASGVLTNTATVRSNESDPNTNNNTATITTPINPVANLVLTKTTTTLLPGPGDELRYTLKVDNTGPSAASSVTLTDPLPANTVFKSLTDQPGWTCNKPAAGSGGTISCMAATFANGASATFTLALTVGNNVAKDTIITNTALVGSAAFDGDQSNNTSSAAARVGAPQTRIVTGGTIDVGPVTVPPTRSQNPAGGNFVLENTGNATLFLTPVSLQRVAPNTDKLASPDDRSLFDVRVMTPSGETPLTYSSNGVITVLPGQQANFHALFNPIIPIRACKTSGLAANQAVPDTINSQLTLITQTGVPVVINLVGRTSAAAKLVHPLDPRRPAQVTLTGSGNNVKVEFWVYDPNMDIYLARYQFLDSAGNPVGLPVDVDLAQDIAAAGLVRGQIFGVEQSFDTGASVSNVRVTIFDRDNNNDSALSGPGGPTDCSIGTVSAASFSEFGLSAESIVAGFGGGLAGAVLSADSNPLPTTLAGTSIRIRDGAGVERLAPLFFVSPSQINYLIPADSSPGAATVTVTGGGNLLAIGTVRIADTGPGLFAANGNGAGVAAAAALRVKADGTQSYEPVARFDPALGRSVAVPIDPGDPSDQVYLIFYGTGIRHHGALDAVRVWIGGVEAPILYAGAQGEYAGLDQINVALPRAVSGRGEVDVVLAVGNSVANRVQVNIGGTASLSGNATALNLVEMPTQPPAPPVPQAVLVMRPIKLALQPAREQR